MKTELPPPTWMLLFWALIMSLVPDTKIPLKASAVIVFSSPNTVASAAI